MKKLVRRPCATCNSDTVHSSSRSGAVCIHCGTPAPDARLSLGKKLEKRRKRMYARYGAFSGQAVLAAGAINTEKLRDKILWQTGNRRQDKPIFNKRGHSQFRGSR